MLAAIPTVLLVIVIGGRWVASRALAPIEEIRKSGRANHRRSDSTATCRSRRLAMRSPA